MNPKLFKKVCKVCRHETEMEDASPEWVEAHKDCATFFYKAKELVGEYRILYRCLNNIGQGDLDAMVVGMKPLENLVNYGFWGNR